MQIPFGGSASPSLPFLSKEMTNNTLLLFFVLCWCVGGEGGRGGIGSSRVYIVGNRREYLRQSLAEALHL